MLPPEREGQEWIPEPNPTIAAATTADCTTDPAYTETVLTGEWSGRTSGVPSSWARQVSLKASFSCEHVKFYPKPSMK